MIVKKEKIKIYIVFVLFLATIISWSAVFAQNGDNFLRVSFFDIGQGSSIFISLPGNTQILIDGGPNNKILHKLGQAMPFYDKKIEVLVLTHPDADHLAGLYEVLKNYEIGLILQTCILGNSLLYQQWQKLIKEQNIQAKCVKAGDSLLLNKRAEFKVLYPFENLSGKTFKDTNQSSVVARLDFGQNSFLLVGDADKKVERGLVFSGADIGADFLQAGHHGSKTSGSKIFIGAVNPKAAIIQVGKDNRYGHPHQEVLDIFELLGVEILRTDISGDINFECNRQECFLANF